MQDEEIETLDVLSKSNQLVQLSGERIAAGIAQLTCWWWASVMNACIAISHLDLHQASSRSMVVTAAVELHQ